MPRSGPVGEVYNSQFIEIQGLSRTVSLGFGATLEIAKRSQQPYLVFSQAQRNAALAHMSNMKYSLGRQYDSCMLNILFERNLPMIEIRIDQLLKARGRTFYW